MAVNYQPINWVNGQAPALNAANLNHMDEGIETAVEEIIHSSEFNKQSGKGDYPCGVRNYRRLHKVLY